MLALLTSVQVQATSYTDYEFVGYEQNAPLVDELTKYEPVTFHKYYSLEEKDVTYVDSFETPEEEYDYCETTPSQKRETISLVPSPKYLSTKTLAIPSEENFETIYLSIDKMKPTFRLTKVEVENKVTKEKNEFAVTVVTSNLQVPLPRTNIENIAVTIHYESTASSEVQFTFNGVGAKKKTVTMAFEPEKGTIQLNLMNSVAYDSFVTTNGLSPTNPVYYTYIEESYKCANYERIYYDTLAVESLEGYTFDPEEDTVLYKVFKRKVIQDVKPEEESPSEDQTPESPSEQTPSVAEPTLPPTTSALRPSSPIANTPPTTTPTIPWKNEEKTEKDEPESNSSDYDRIAFLEPDETYPATEERIREDGETCIDELEILKTMREIKLLLLILIILTIFHTIHLFRVNRRQLK